MTAVAVLAWAGTLVAVAWLAFAYALPEDLTATRLGYGRLAAVAFLGRVFTFHTGLALATAALFALLARRWRLLAVAGVAAPVVLVPTGYACRPRHPAAAAGPTLRVLSLNLEYENVDTAAVLHQIDLAAADVVVLQEYTAAFDAALRPALSPTYPHQCRQPRTRGYGMAVYARQPFAQEPVPDVAVDHLGQREQIRFGVMVGSTPITVFAVHPAAPLDTGRILKNRRQTLDYLDQLKSNAGPTLLVGDWNFTAETANAAALRHAGLTDAFDQASPGGRGTTWPMHPPLWSYPPGIRLDHAYVSPGLRCTRYTTGGRDGSDHLPIVVDVTAK